MPNGLSNWSEKDVNNFLKEKGFIFYEERKGSHYALINYRTEAIVEINLNKGSYPIRTLETMIRQSKIQKKEWRKWASK
jgi:predicted RNA binding protein YcfA (HicA-like mRNA interferase family)